MVYDRKKKVNCAVWPENVTGDRAGESVDGYRLLDDVVRRDGVGREQMRVPWGVKAYFEAYITAAGRLRIWVINGLW